MPCRCTCLQVLRMLQVVQVVMCVVGRWWTASVRGL